MQCKYSPDKETFGTKLMTFGEMFDAAMKCKSKKAANKLLTEQAIEMMKYLKAAGKEPKKFDEAVSILKSNLGYMTGYYGPGEGVHIRKYFNAVHPFFGNAFADGKMTNKKAFKLGLKLGKKIKHEHKKRK